VNLATLQRAIENAPTAPAANPAIRGWWLYGGNPLYICAHCAARIMARGCSLGSCQPVWTDQPAPSAWCALCTTQRLALEFSRELRDALTPEQMTDVVVLNQTPRFKDHGCCATHNYCDANVVMADAFETVVGREPVLPCDGAESDQIDADSALMDEAWTLARAAGFEVRS